MQIPIAQVAKISLQQGPPAIKSENSRLTDWIYVDLSGIDVATYVNNAKQLIDKEVTLPVGYNIVWSGQYEYMETPTRGLPW